jgi:hypothetical protein
VAAAVARDPAADRGLVLLAEGVELDDEVSVVAPRRELLGSEIRRPSKRRQLGGDGLRDLGGDGALGAALAVLGEVKQLVPELEDLEQLQVWPRG